MVVYHVETTNKDYYQCCQFRHSTVYIALHVPHVSHEPNAVNAVQQSWGAKFCSGTNNSDKDYKHVPEHGFKFNLREDNNLNKSDSLLIYNI